MKQTSPISTKFDFGAIVQKAKSVNHSQIVLGKRDYETKTYFFINIHRRALPIVCVSSWIWNVAADRSGSAPFIYNFREYIPRDAMSCVGLTIRIFGFDSAIV